MPPSSASAAERDAGPRRRDPDPSGSGDEVDPLGGFAGHARAAFAAARDRVALAADEAAGRFRRALIRALLLVFAVALSFVFAALGVVHVVGGAIAGLEPLVGSRWGAELLVGIASLVASAALIVLPLARARRRRLAELRRRYPDSTPETA